MARFDNQVALITGGAGGIGEVTARQWLADGGRVHLVDLKEEALRDAANQLGAGDKVSYTAANVTQSADNARMLQDCLQSHSRLDFFFANAGIEGVVTPLVDYPEDKFDQVLAVNVKGIFLGLKHILPHLYDRKSGSVVLMSSVAGLAGTPNVSAYVTSKHAVVGLMKVAALESAPHGVRVNSVHPSPVQTRMMRSLEEGFNPGKGKEMEEAFAKNIPLGRYAEPQEVADLVLFLASEQANFLTGNTYVVDGGMQAL